MIWLCILILLPYGYYCGLTRFSYFIFPECLRGWLDYPGHSVLFSRPLRGVPRVLSRSITPLLLWIPNWHFFSRPLVASLGFSGGPVSPEFPFRHLTGISFIFFWILGRSCLAQLSINFHCLSLTYNISHFSAHANIFIMP